MVWNSLQNKHSFMDQKAIIQGTKSCLMNLIFGHLRNTHLVVPISVILGNDSNGISIHLFM